MTASRYVVVMSAMIAGMMTRICGQWEVVKWLDDRWVDGKVVNDDCRNDDEDL